MDPIALSIGMQGKFDVSLDGMKAQLEAEKAAAAQRIKEQEKKDAEINDIYKSATDLLDGSKYLPVYHSEVKTQSADLFRRMDEAVRAGKSVMEIKKMIIDSRESLDAMKRSTDITTEAIKKGDVPQSVIQAVMDPKGQETLIQAAHDNFQTTVPYGDKGQFVFFPQKIEGTYSKAMETLSTMKLPTEFVSDQTKAFQVPENPEKRIILQEKQTPEEKKRIITDTYYELLTSPKEIANTVMSVFGKNDQRIYAPGPDGMGMVLTPEAEAVLKGAITQQLERNPNLKTQTTSIVKKDEPKPASRGLAETSRFVFTTPQQSYVPWAKTEPGVSGIKTISSSTLQPKKAAKGGNITVSPGDLMVDYSKGGSVLKRAGRSGDVIGPYSGNAMPFDIRVMSDEKGQAVEYIGWAIPSKREEGLGAMDMESMMSGGTTGKVGAIVYKKAEEDQIEALAAVTEATIAEINSLFKELRSGATGTAKKPLAPKSAFATSEDAAANQGQSGPVEIPGFINNTDELPD